MGDPPFSTPSWMQAAWQLEDVLHDVNIDVYPDKPDPQF
jgi:hypothetical protein